MGLLKAANGTPVAWVNDEQSPYPSSYQPVMALAQNHIHFLDVPGVPAGSADIFVIHCTSCGFYCGYSDSSLGFIVDSYFQPQSQAYPLPNGDAFPAMYGKATSFFQDSGVCTGF